MLVTYILFVIIILCASTYVGLNIAQKVENNNILYILFWIIYIIVLIGIFNVVLLANFWDTIQHKTGPPGPRGPMGEQGDTGTKGLCGNDCRFKQGILFIHELLDTKMKKITGKSIFITKTYIKYDLSEGERKSITPDFNKFILEKINQMMNSKQYKITAPVKGTNNLNNYLKQIWGKWIDLLKDAGATKDNFFFNKFADDTLWLDGNEEMKKNNPFPEMEKYDVYVWGQLREFKPLNIEICSNSRKSNYFPQEYKKPLQTIITNRYEWIYNDLNEITYTGTELKNDHISIWRPLKHTYENEIYYPVGDIIFSSKDRTRYGENGLKDSNGNDYSPRKRRTGNTKYKLLPKLPIPILEFVGYSRGSYSVKTYLQNMNIPYVGSIGIPNNFMNTIKFNPVRYLPTESNSAIGNGTGTYYYLFSGGGFGGKSTAQSSSSNNLVDIVWKLYMWDIDFLKRDKGWDDEVSSFIFRSKSDKGYFGGPEKKTILVTGDIRAPIDYKLIYKNNRTIGTWKYSLWEPIPPAGYVALGHIANIGFGKPPTGQEAPVRCVPEKCVFANDYLLKKSPDGKEINCVWDSKDIPGASRCKYFCYNRGPTGEATHDNNYNLFKGYVNPIDGERKDPLYRLNPKCLSNVQIDSAKDTTEDIINNSADIVKKLEQENNELGIGWYGFPERDAKYSIFSFLGLMPESIITNSFSRRKYYMIHSQKQKIMKYDDPKIYNKIITTNSYLILIYNPKTLKYDRGLGVSGDNQVSVVISSNADIRQLWEIEYEDEEQGTFRLKSKETGKYLHHNVTKNLREAPIETQSNQIDNSHTLFYNNKSAFGTSLKIMKERNKITKDEFKEVEKKGATKLLNKGINNRTYPTICIEKTDGSNKGNNGKKGHKGLKKKELIDKECIKGEKDKYFVKDNNPGNKIDGDYNPPA
jgi:hypothetical protein